MSRSKLRNSRTRDGSRAPAKDERPKTKCPRSNITFVQHVAALLAEQRGAPCVGPAGFSKTGSIDVSQSNKISATIAGLPAGTGYTVTLSATSTDSSLTCIGSASFNVTARSTTPVTVAVICKETSKTGSVLVNGALNICPVADGISANPSSLDVGGSVVLAAQGHDSDAAPAALSYQWSASSGTLSSTSGAGPTFTCTSAGTATLTLTVSDGDTTSGCADTLTTDITCAAPTLLCQGGNLKVKLLGLNDFHGQISAGKLVSGRPVGSAGVFSAYLKSAQAGIESQTVIVHAGDHVGASPASSALLQDEPSIQWLNMLANASCTYADKVNAACNVVGTLGNHEFDKARPSSCACSTAATTSEDKGGLVVTEIETSGEPLGEWKFRLVGTELKVAPDPK